MSAQGSVPAARSTLGVVITALVVGAIAGFAGFVYGKRAADANRTVMSATPPDRQHVALVRERPCDGGRCQTLWLGGTSTDAVEILQLGGGEKVEEIAFSEDGSLVGFVVNGYQLRVFESETRKARATVELLKPERIPSNRIARGVTFSANGAAVTYDDCPRRTSGCKSGLSAVR
jgi:hypothetical protein